MDYRLVPSQPEDEPFLWRLNQLAYEPVVTAQFGGWEPVKQRMFFDNKLKTQSYSLIVTDDGPIGAVTKAWEEGGLRLLELLVLPAHQNEGIGTRILRQLQDEARAERQPLLLQVLHLNKAKKLYERLGFRVVETTETHYRMRWDADGAG